MPQFQVLEQNPSFGNQLASQLGQGIGEGVNLGIQSSLKNFQDRKAKLEKNLSKLQPSFKFHSKLARIEDLPEEESTNIYNNAKKYVQNGYEAEDAVQQSITDYRRSLEDDTSGKEMPESFYSKIKNLPLKDLLGASGSIPQIGEELKKFFAPPEEKAPQVPRKNIPALLQEAEDVGPQAYNKLLSTLSAEEFKSLPRAQQIELSKELGQSIIPGEVSQTIARGLLGRKGADRIAEAGGLPGVEFGSEQAQGLGEAYGSILKDLGIFGAAGTRGLGKESLPLGKQALKTGALFGGAKAAEQGIGGEQPTLGSVGSSATFGAATELAGPLLGRLFNFIKSKVPVRTFQSAAKSAQRPPGIKQIEFKGGARDIPPPFTGPHTAGEAEKVYEDILQNSLKNLNDRGITVEAINAGDPVAVKALQEEVNKSSELFKKSQKLNVNKFNKEMAKTEKRLSESPLEKYYEVKPERNRRPETVAAQELRNKELQKFIDDKAKEALDLQVKILEQDSILKSGNFDEGARNRIESLRKLNALNHTRAIDGMRNARFEMKYGRPPATSEQIDKQINDTFNKLREGIEKPDVKKVETFRKGFERDKHLIDEATALAAKGDLPGEAFDEYIKIHKKYVDAYGQLANELKDFIGSSLDPAKVERAKDLLKIVKNSEKLGKAKIKLQEDKKKAMRLLNKPSGAFMKNSLRHLRSDVEAFQKDFFKWNKIGSKAEQKTERVAKKVLGEKPQKETVFKRETQSPKEPPKVQKEHTKGEFGEAQKTAEEAAKNPTGNKAKTAAERAGMSEKEYREYLDKFKNLGENFKNTDSLESEKKLLKSFIDFYKKLPKYQKSVANGILMGTAQGIIEETTGWKPPTSAISTGAALATKGTLPYRIGAAGIAPLISNWIKKGSNHAKAEKLSKLRRDPKEYNDYMRKLKSKYGDARANKIRKEALQSS